MDRNIFVNKRVKGMSREELAQLSTTELIDKIVQLEAYNFQLKNLLQKKLNEKDKTNSEYVNVLYGEATQNKTNSETKKERPIKVKLQRQFNWESAYRRHVLLKVMYFGWDYQGFACQEDSADTIGKITYLLDKALIRTCLIESRSTSNYHRCGRTDKEVSAFCQVISIDLRSKHPPELQLQIESLKSELDYCSILNRVLPKNIQCVAWMPLRNSDYSARFDCISRTYRYYFPKGDLDIEAMGKACQLLICHGDFRNFCKMDVHNGVTNYKRNVQHAEIKRCHTTITDPDATCGYTMYYFEIKANAFLWHQIRCIMAVLLLVGHKHEKPCIISKLLDVDNHPCKPQYSPATGLPLNLFCCEFRTHSTCHPNPPTGLATADDSMKNTDLITTNPNSEEGDLTHWVYSKANLQKLIENVQSEWTQFSVKCTMIQNSLEQLEELLEENFTAEKLLAQTMLLEDSKTRQYQPLLQRKRCESLENRICHFVKKKKLVTISKETHRNESNFDS